MYNFLSIIALLPVVVNAERLGSPDSGKGKDITDTPIQSKSPNGDRQLRRIGAGGEVFDKPSYRDESIPLLEGSSALEDGERKELSCASNEKVFKFDLTTDNYGFEFSWELVKGNGQLVASGPPYNSNYGDNTYYTGSQCLPPGSYKLIARDKFKDGMCCSYGRGHYEMYLDGAKLYGSPMYNQAFAEREHSFSVAGIDANARSGCTPVAIELKVDQFGTETSWTLKSSSGSTVMSLSNIVPAYGYKKVEQCVSPGDYTFQINDSDGICCRYGEGYFKIWVDGTLLVTGGGFLGSTSHKIKVGYDYYSGMSSRAKEWLNAHNSRRKTWHQRQGVAYNPLRWSFTLENDAKYWANQLLNDCNIVGISHQSGVEEGENLAKNKGQSSTFGTEYPADNVVSRWVEMEESEPYPHNAHLTQVLWRPSSYLGCGDASKSMGNGEVCRVQVCRYAKAGNCAMGQFNGNWRAATFQEDSPCGPQCPTEGCYAP